ncbi:unnamed protein product [Cylindrotheca closterium]|uniref:F-box domain-containing protein n=1 Tax=Cylindrotheca closterium TaxID=2856 RepID=A0AAD2FQD9_9STRA|nr:unnamed protein product [Cylindrotheca closterium]
MADLNHEGASTILYNTEYLTLILGWLLPEEIMNCAPVCKQWSTGVSQTWKRFLQNISPLLYEATVNTINKNEQRMPPEQIFKQFALREYKLRQDAYCIPTETTISYRNAVKERALKRRHKEAMSIVHKQGCSSESYCPPGLKLEDVFLVLHLYHAPTRTRMGYAIWNLNDVMEDGLIYGKGSPILMKDIDFQIPIGSFAEHEGPLPATASNSPRSAFWQKCVATSLDELGVEMIKTAIVCVQMYRCDSGKTLSFERGQMMWAKYERLLGLVRTDLQKSWTNPNPASFPLPDEDDQYFDPNNVNPAMSKVSKQYPCIGFEIGVAKVAPMNVSNFTPANKGGRMTVEVHLSMYELFPGHHRTTIRWKEDLRKHLQFMDWE